MPEAKKTSSARSLAPPFQLRPAALGSQLVGRPAGGIFPPLRNIDFNRPFQNKRTSAKQMSFYFGFRRPKSGSTFRDFHARGGRTAPAPRFSPAAKTLVRRTRAAAQKGRLAVLLQRPRPSKISILTTPSSSSQAPYRLRRFFSFHCKAYHALILLLFASKANLRRAPWGTASLT